MKRLEKLVSGIADLVFPPKCIFCQSIIRPGCTVQVCGTCHDSLRFNERIMNAIQAGCEQKCWCDGVLCPLRYQGKVKDAVIRYKFHGKQSYCKTFAVFICQVLKQSAVAAEIDSVVSVPLHKNRLADRGYNQSELISKHVAGVMGLDECSSALARTRDTKAQSSLPGHSRAQNISGAFAVCNESRVRGRSILLIDDIMTTGMTINECSRVLKLAGAKTVTAAVIASGRMRL